MSAPQNVPVSTTAAIVCTAAAGVQYQIMNIGNVTAYISNNASVTSTTGFPLTPNSFINWYSAQQLGGAVYAIVASVVSGNTGTTLSVTGDAT